MVFMLRRPEIETQRSAAGCGNSSTGCARVPRMRSVAASGAGHARSSSRSKLMVPVTGFVRSAGSNLSVFPLIVPLAGQWEKCARENFAARMPARLDLSRLADVASSSGGVPAVGGAPEPGGAPAVKDPLVHSHRNVPCAEEARSEVEYPSSVSLALPFTEPVPHFSWKIAAAWE